METIKQQYRGGRGAGLWPALGEGFSEAKGNANAGLRKEEKSIMPLQTRGNKPTQRGSDEFAGTKG